MKSFDLVIVGVGGQGTLLASKILGRLALLEGCGVKVSEVHGMSQRGGSVITYVRIGEQLHSPIVAMGTADFLISFELLEAGRAAGYLKPEGVAIVNTQRIAPMPVITGAVKYPDSPLHTLGARTVESADALQIATECGSPRALNLVLLGMLSRHLSFDTDTWKRAIAESVPRKTLSVNIDAFERGRALND